jgi:hypothetical protein
MREDLSIESGVQFDWTSDWLGWSFTHGNAETGRQHAWELGRVSR